MIPEAAVEAAAKALHFYKTASGWANADPATAWECMEQAESILRQAAPHMLSHECEETRLAHLDAVVNARTVDKLNAAIEAVLALICKPDASAVPRNQPDLVPPFYSDRIRAAITKALQ